LRTRGREPAFRDVVSIERLLFVRLALSPERLDARRLVLPGERLVFRPRTSDAHDGQ
jgi:hypothetical protein